ncbi:hypothetical protein [Geothrix fuzhouensis]|uniref:hypothetical protein n=1 Tax=Geothrix fuzhouensis TaxID=2966451 RepID=UPI0021478D8C|nr:hypothetical protein [Geothrix fuzhouensis]
MSTQPFDPTRDHRISREEAASLVRNHHVHAEAGAHRASAFNRSAFEQLLAQPGAAGIRIYHARHADGSPTMVMVAVDAQGTDVASAEAVYIQNTTDCPPICSGTTLGPSV